MCYCHTIMHRNNRLLNRASDAIIEWLPNILSIMSELSKRGVAARRLSFLTLYKALVTGAIVPTFAFTIIAGILSLCGYEIFKEDGGYVTGLRGFKAAALAMIAFPLIAIFFTTLVWCWTSVGLWLYSKVQPMMLYYYPHLNGSTCEESETPSRSVAATSPSGENPAITP